MCWGLRLKILALLFVIAALQVLVAATSLGVDDLGLKTNLGPAFGLANALLSLSQLVFGGFAAWRVARVDAEAA